METKQLIEIGTRVIVTNNLSGHNFIIGQICECKSINGEAYEFKTNTDRLGWMESSEFEIIVPESANHQTDNSEKPNKAK